MKKIVALVLTLVLALSLATVAFAANNAYLTTTVKGDPIAFGALQLKDTKYYTLSLEKVKEANEDYNTVDQYKIFMSITGTDVSLPLPGVYVEATSDDFDVIFYTAKETHYLNQYLLGAYSGEATAIDSVLSTDVARWKTVPCGTYVVYDEETSLYDYEGTVMMATAFSLANLQNIKAIALVDGNLVALTTATEGDDYDVVAHTYVADWSVAADGTLKVNSVTCSYCKKAFDFVVGSKADATKAFGAGNFVALAKNAWGGIVDGDLVNKLGTKDIWISTAAAADDAAADGNKDVKSATTFDAGVALYAGMALMSVAGSAVVIGKKKEF